MNGELVAYDVACALVRDASPDVGVETVALSGAADVRWRNRFTPAKTSCRTRARRWTATPVGLHLLTTPLLCVLPENSVARGTVKALLRGSVEAKAARTYAVHVALEYEGVRLVARVMNNQCSSLVSSAARADGLALFPPGERRYSDDDSIDVMIAGVPRSAHARDVYPWIAGAR